MFCRLSGTDILSAVFAELRFVGQPREFGIERRTKCPPHPVFSMNTLRFLSFSSLSD